MKKELLLKYSKEQLVELALMLFNRLRLEVDFIEQSVDEGEEPINIFNQLKLNGSNLDGAILK